MSQFNCLKFAFQICFCFRLYFLRMWYCFLIRASLKYEINKVYATCTENVCCFTYFENFTSNARPRRHFLLRRDAPNRQVQIQDDVRWFFRQTSASASNNQVNISFNLSRRIALYLEKKLKCEALVSCCWGVVLWLQWRKREPNVLLTSFNLS